MNTPTPDPNQHEVSRPAFEAPYPPGFLERDEHGDYFSPLTYAEWQTWRRALDHAAAQAEQDACPTCGSVNWKNRLSKQCTGHTSSQTE